MSTPYAHSPVGLGDAVFTTGQVARLVGCALRTAAKFIDTGRLKGHRIPGSTFRRVRRADLVAFLRQHQLAHALKELGESP